MAAQVLQHFRDKRVGITTCKIVSELRQHRCVAPECTGYCQILGDLGSNNNVAIRLRAEQQLRYCAFTKEAFEIRMV